MWLKMRGFQEFRDADEEVAGMKRVLVFDEAFEIFANLAFVAVIVATIIVKAGS